ncbi:MAG: hypothetical protein QOE13_2599 [Gaiellaceae bacterium]|nr:hypothetical protein [Gaiellaceae bacterium]
MSLTTSSDVALRVGPFALVLAVAVALWLASGVGPGEVALFAAYEIGFVAVPGWLLYRVLAPESSLGRTIVFGWVLGYALEILAYLAASELGARNLFSFYPLLALPLIPEVWRVRRARGWGRAATAFPVAAVWTAAGVGVVTLAYLGIAYFARTPLPWDVGQVTYDTDVPFSLGIAAEALHHWPMVDPNVSGLAVHYHVWAHLDLAATSQVTGLALPLVLFRLAVFPLTLLFVAEMLVAGRVFAGRALVGAFAAGLLLLVGEVDPEPWYSFPFLNYFFLDVWLSPTFLLGLVFFAAALTLIGERIKSTEPIRPAWRTWVLIAIMLIACAGAKPPALAVLGGGLVLTAGWILWTQRRVDANAAVGLGVVVAVFGVYYIVTYRHSALGLGAHPFESFGNMPWVHDLRQSVGDGAGWPLGVLLGALGLWGPALVGLVAFFGLRRARLDAGRFFLLAVLIAGVGPYVLYWQPANAQVYFSHYALVGGTLLAAEGLVLLGSLWSRAGVIRSAAAIALATAVALVTVVYVIETNLLHPRAALAIVVLAIVAALMWRWSAPSGRRAPLVAAGFAAVTAVVLLLWRFGWNPNQGYGGYELVTALLAVTMLAVALARRTQRWEAFFAVAVTAIAIGALDLPLDQGPNAVDRLRSGAAFSEAHETGLSRGLYQGLTWIRANTTTNAVLAVNNYRQGNSQHGPATYFYYAAFSERRVFLEGWLFTSAAWNILGEDALTSKRIPFPERFRLNEAVFKHADQKALKILVRKYGVRYLVDDKAQGNATPALAHLGKVAFSNPAVTVYAVGPAEARRG